MLIDPARMSETCGSALTGENGLLFFVPQHCWTSHRGYSLLKGMVGG